MSTRHPIWAALTLTIVQGLVSGPVMRAQEFTYRGFADVGVLAYPQEAPNDPTQAIADVQARFESTLRVRRVFALAGSLDARMDSHDQTAHRAEVTFWDRTIQRPALAVRTLTATLARGPLTVELGKQFLRWGQSDILSPTDYFTARDYVLTVNSEVLAATAARVTYSGPDDSLEVVYAPRMTPSRLPLLDQRWVGLQAATSGLTLTHGGAHYPGGPRYGARWRHVGRRLEYSASFFHGAHHLPLLDLAVSPEDARLVVERRYPAIRAWGADAVVPLSGVAIKAEAAWLQARHKDADDYGLWVLQAERQQADWLVIGGYVGEWVSAERGAFGFAPDRGVARSLIGRLSRTLDSGRTLLVETVARRNGDGLYAKAEYSQGFAARWRLTVQALLIRGGPDDFLGQYRRNSLTATRARYSF